MHLHTWPGHLKQGDCAGDGHDDDDDDAAAAAAANAQADGVTAALKSTVISGP